MALLLLDGPRNGDYKRWTADAFADGYVFDEATSAAWKATGERGDVMVYHEVTSDLEVKRDADTVATEIVHEATPFYVNRGTW